MSVMYDKATVLKDELTGVAGKDRFHVNNLLDKKHEPRHVCAILRDAHSLLGLELPYCLLRGNCEHFVTELRYGRAESQQVGWLICTYLHVCVFVCFLSRAPFKVISMHLPFHG